MADQTETIKQQLLVNDDASFGPSDRIEDLRRILEEEQDREITYVEANDVGESLLAFFQVLAQDNTEAA